MTFAIHGLPVARGIALGRAVLVASSRVDVAHYFIESEQIKSEVERLRVARDAVIEELQRLQATMPKVHSFRRAWAVVLSRCICTASASCAVSSRRMPLGSKK